MAGCLLSCLPRLRGSRTSTSSSSNTSGAATSNATEEEDVSVGFTASGTTSFAGAAVMSSNSKTRTADGKSKRRNRVSSDNKVASKTRRKRRDKKAPKRRLIHMRPSAMSSSRMDPTSHDIDACSLSGSISSSASKTRSLSNMKHHHRTEQDMIRAVAQAKEVHKKVSVVSHPHSSFVVGNEKGVVIEAGVSSSVSGKSESWRKSDTIRALLSYNKSRTSSVSGAATESHKGSGTDSSSRSGGSGSSSMPEAPKIGDDQIVRFDQLYRRQNSNKKEFTQSQSSSAYMSSVSAPVSLSGIPAGAPDLAFTTEFAMRPSQMMGPSDMTPLESPRGLSGSRRSVDRFIPVPVAKQPALSEHEIAVEHRMKVMQQLHRSVVRLKVGYAPKRSVNDRSNVFRLRFGLDCQAMEENRCDISALMKSCIILAFVIRYEYMFEDTCDEDTKFEVEQSVVCWKNVKWVDDGEDEGLPCEVRLSFDQLKYHTRIVKLSMVAQFADGATSDVPSPKIRYRIPSLISRIMEPSGIFDLLETALVYNDDDELDHYHKSFEDELKSEDSPSPSLPTDISFEPFTVSLPVKSVDRSKRTSLNRFATRVALQDSWQECLDNRRMDSGMRKTKNSSRATDMNYLNLCARSSLSLMQKGSEAAAKAKALELQRNSKVNGVTLTQRLARTLRAGFNSALPLVLPLRPDDDSVASATKSSSGSRSGPRQMSITHSISSDMHPIRPPMDVNLEEKDAAEEDDEVKEEMVLVEIEEKKQPLRLEDEGLVELSDDSESEEEETSIPSMMHPVMPSLTGMPTQLGLVAIPSSSTSNQTSLSMAGLSTRSNTLDSRTTGLSSFVQQLLMEERDQRPSMDLDYMLPAADLKKHPSAAMLLGSQLCESVEIAAMATTTVSDSSLHHFTPAAGIMRLHSDSGSPPATVVDDAKPTAHSRRTFSQWASSIASKVTRAKQGKMNDSRKDGMGLESDKSMNVSTLDGLKKWDDPKQAASEIRLVVKDSSSGTTSGTRRDSSTASSGLLMVPEGDLLSLRTVWKSIQSISLAHDNRGVCWSLACTVCEFAFGIVSEEERQCMMSVDGFQPEVDWRCMDYLSVVSLAACYNASPMRRDLEFGIHSGDSLTVVPSSRVLKECVMMKCRLCQGRCTRSDRMYLSRVNKLARRKQGLFPVVWCSDCMSDMMVPYSLLCETLSDSLHLSISVDDCVWEIVEFVLGTGLFRRSVSS